MWSVVCARCGVCARLSARDGVCVVAGRMRKKSERKKERGGVADEVFEKMPDREFYGRGQLINAKWGSVGVAP